MADAFPIPELTDGTVTLRAHRATDVDAVLERCRDPDTVRWTTVPADYTRPMAEEYVAGLGPSPTQISWAMEADGRYTGTIDLRSWGPTPDDRHVAGDLGFVTHQRARGHGLMGRAVRLVLDHAFDTLGWDTVVWQANVGNVASYKAAWRAGFPIPTFVPSLIKHRGQALDGWHAAMHPDDLRHPLVAWEEALASLERDISRATRPG